jgi:hypothetical protein
VQERSLKQSGDDDSAEELGSHYASTRRDHLAPLAGGAVLVKIRPLCLLYAEGPISRSYIHMLRAEGMAPDVVIHLVNERDVATGRPVGRCLPAGPRRRYAAWVQDVKMNFWPRHIRKNYRHLWAEMTGRVAEEIDVPKALFDTIVGPNPLASGSSVVVPVMVRNLGDVRLLEAIRRIAPSTVVFSGGGIVPPALLEVVGNRLLHVHPGLLPNVRGADGLLWSTLVRGHPGVSSLFLSAGIDAGDIVRTREFPPVAFYPRVPVYDDALLYRAIYSFYDPAIRARHLIDTLRAADAGDGTLIAYPQPSDCGVTYRFMHRVLRRKVLSRLFPR